MGHLTSFVKTLALLKEEQSYADEIVLEQFDLVFARGAITEIAGKASSGKTSIAMSLLAKLTATGETCAVVDACGGFDAVSAARAGVELKNLLWIKCDGDIEKSFLAADYLVQAKGFGCIWLNLNGLSDSKLRLVPKTYWYRYRTRIKETPTLLVITSSTRVTGPASQHTYQIKRARAIWSGMGRFKLLRGFDIRIYSGKGFYGLPQWKKIEMNHSQI